MSNHRSIPKPFSHPWKKAPAVPLCMRKNRGKKTSKPSVIRARTEV